MYRRSITTDVRIVGSKLTAVFLRAERDKSGREIRPRHRISRKKFGAALSGAAQSRGGLIEVRAAR